MMHRRELLARSTLGVGTLALAWLLDRDRLLAESIRNETPKYDLTPKAPHFQPRARAMMALCAVAPPRAVRMPATR